MSSNTLSGAGVTPAATKHQLLHIGTGTLGAGAVVRLGDGTATPLTLSSAGISVAGSIAATSMSAGGVDVKPAQWKRLTANVLATDTTPVALSELDFMPENGAVYEVELLLIVTSAATAGAAQITNTGGAGTLYLLDPQTALGIVATGGSYSPTTSPVAGTWALMLKGIFIASSTANLAFALKSDDTNDVTALAGSYLRVTKIS
ncbi:MAG: hypothetical protein MUF86_11395 [Akkermansiaceae bacterium]|jgi:hypothetical protein|nr:hypothetical protein [Akkermansiaceae bacterium]MCU0778257.1 hypothetical protein [Akkermansiaceae bacterium]